VICTPLDRKCRRGHSFAVKAIDTTWGEGRPLFVLLFVVALYLLYGYIYIFKVGLAQIHHPDIFPRALAVGRCQIAS